MRVDSVARQVAHAAILLFALSAAEAKGQIRFDDCGRSLEQSSVTLELLSEKTVRVRSIGNGLGFVVGWDESTIWLATPAHVVFGEAFLDPGAPPSGLFFSQEDVAVRLLNESFELELCSDNNKLPNVLLDLTFVCVRRPAAALLSAEVVAARLSSGDEYYVLGRRESIEASQLAGTLEVLEGPGQLRLHPSTNAVPGYGDSGAMVVTPAGLAGMYVGSLETGRAISIREIREAARRADLPWKLTDAEYFDCTTTQQACFLADSGPLPNALLLRRGADVPIELLLSGGEACAELPEGQYLLEPLGEQLACEPMHVQIRSQSSRILISLACIADLSGAWHSADFGTLHCASGLFGSAYCFGLEGMGRGLFSGSLTADGARISLTGRFQGAYTVEASGSLRWDSGQLQGSIQLSEPESEPIALILEPVR